MPTTSLHVEAFGVLVDLKIPEDDVAEAAARAWADAIVSSAATDGRTVLTLSVARTSHSDADVTGKDVDELLHRLSTAVTLAALDAQAGRHVLLHAAALANPRTGATAVLVAPSGTGKTTACRVLGRDLVYLTDETAAVTDDGVVLQYRKPLSLVQDGPLKRQVAASDLGLRTDEITGHLSALAMLERSEAHEGPPVVERVETVEALAILAPQASALARTDRPLHRLARMVHRAAGLRVVRYRETSDLTTVVSDLLVVAP